MASFGSAAADILPMPRIELGGTELLGHFFEQTEAFGDCSELWICAPFVEHSQKLHPKLLALKHSQMSLFFITASEAGAREAWTSLKPLGWRDFHVGIYDRVHAKIYLALGRSGRICMIGSHNFTGGGVSGNYEAGTLMLSAHQDEISYAVYAVRDELDRLIRVCRKVYNPVVSPAASD